MAVYPAPQATLVSTELDVRFQFNEWIKNPVAKGAVRISPPLSRPLQSKVEGDMVLFYSQAPLESLTTYSLQVGSGILDLRSNPLVQPFELVFSTGPVVDSLSLMGKVRLPDSLRKKRRYPVVGLYPMGEEIRRSKKYLQALVSDSTPLSLTPILTREPALYISETDSNGSFRFSGLASGKYQLVAFDDLNQNNTANPIYELAGVAETEIEVLPQTDSLPILHYILIGDQDTTALEVSEVSQQGARYLRLQFSRPPLLERSLHDSAQCGLWSLDTQLIIPTLGFWPGKSPKELIFMLQNIPSSDEYLAGCAQVQDSAYRPLSPRFSRLRLTWQEDQDTLDPKFSGLQIAGGSPTTELQPWLELRYSLPVHQDTLAPRIRLLTGTDTMMVNATKISPVQFNIQPQNPLPSGSKVKVVLLSADSVESDSSLQDIQILGSFETINPLKLGGLQGKIPGADTQTVVLLHPFNSRKPLQTHCNTQGQFLFERIPAGTYALEYYMDLNHDGKPTPGLLNPYQSGDLWRWGSDSIEVIASETPTLLDPQSPLPSLPYRP